MQNKKITIIGFGRFGKTLARLLQGDFELTIFDRDDKAFSTPPSNKVKKTNDLKEAYKNDIIFYSIPISKFEAVIKTHKRYVRPDHLLVDVLSVKRHPKEVFKRELPQTNVLLTHPMFGPDSSKEGFDGLPIVLDGSLCEKDTFAFWKNYFESKKLKIVEMSAEEHDKLAARSQGVTHLIGRILDEFGLESTSIDTYGSKLLYTVKEQTCNDTWELFSNLQTYNPYTKKMRLDFGAAYDKVFDKLLPKKVEEGTNVFGIQGGVGSFNEQALKEYVARHDLENHKIKYLYTSERVLKSLYEGDIDFGLFAIHNSVGGIVEESIEAMAKYKFDIIEEFSIKISHHLMKLPQTKKSKITTIIAHPQVLRQCKTTLEKKYPELGKISGEGDLVDTAAAAKALKDGKLPGSYAVLGPIGLSDLYEFDVIDTNLQDNKENYTAFLMCSR